MDDIVDVDITAPSGDWLSAFTASLVADRLVASGNLSTEVHTIYRWRGAVRKAPEARVTLHTRASLVPAILERVNHDHPYEVPGVRVIAVEVSAAYRQWVLDSTDTAG